MIKKIKQIMGRRMIVKLLLHGVLYGREIYVSPEKKANYFSIPKSACSSIKAALLNLDDISQNQNIHIAASKSGIHKYKDRDDDYYDFTFVRNPLTRLISCYENKIVNQRPYFTDYLFGILRKNMSFEKFVKIVCKIPDFLSDPHFKGQYFTIFQYDKFQLDFIGKVENKEDFLLLEKKLNISISTRNSTKYKTQNIIAEYYNKELLQLVYKRYKKDFQFFHYEKEYNEALDNTP